MARVLPPPRLRGGVTTRGGPHGCVLHRRRGCEECESVRVVQASAAASIAHYGGRYRVRGGTHEVLEGEWHPTRLVVLEFPSVDAAKRWYASPEYGDVKPIRLEHAVSDMVLVEGI